MSLNAIATSAFGRRTVTRAQIEAQLAVGDARAAGKGAPGEAGAVHKWAVLRMLGEIRDGLAISDRALAVLSALLSFHPETALTLEGDEDGIEGAYAGLVVFPSNRALSLRCNGMSEPTLRRHLAALVEAGLIIRRDSPNGKRYARRGVGEGAPVTQAFGFDLAPLVARAGEFEARLEALRAERLRLRLLKERINLLRRDLSKRLDFAREEGLAGPWAALEQDFARNCTPLRKVRHASELTALAEALDAVRARLATALAAALARDSEQATKDQQKSSADADQSERRLSESNPDQLSSFEHAFKKAGGEIEANYESSSTSSPVAMNQLPLPLVLDACRDIADFAVPADAIATWRGFIDVAARVRPMLGVSPDAWREAVEKLGERQGAVAVAFILQRSEFSSEAQIRLGADGRSVVTVNGSPAIRSPGGYLRALTQKGGAGGLWPAVLAHLAQRAKWRAGQGGSQTPLAGGLR